MDYESNEEFHQKKFFGMLDELKTINTRKSSYQYGLGYSNLAFELWLLLHKDYNFTALAHRKNYIDPINKAYGTKFERMKDNKHKEPFDKLLSQISLQDVIRAINVAEKIRNIQVANGNSMADYKGFRYFRDNPDLTVNECIKWVFMECGIV